MKSTKRKILNMALAVLISMGLWLYVVNVENPTGSGHLRDLAVEVQGEETLESRGLMVTELSQERMNLKVTGKKKTLMRLDKKNVYLTVDVSSITEVGEWDLTCRPVFPTQVSSDSITVSSWNDMKVTVTVRKQESKTIPVRGEFIGTEADGCLAGAVETDPAALVVKGPSESLDQVSYALVQVGGESVSDTIQEQINVVLMGTDGQAADVKNVTISATSVQVTVPVRRVVSIPLTVTLQPGGGATAEDADCTISPASVTVVEEGDGSDLPESISLGTIDLSQVYGKTSYSLPIQLPEGVTGWNCPSFATVTLSLEKLASRQMATENITLKNVPQGYTAQLVNAALYVWVRGDPSQVAQLNASQIAVEVDLARANLGDELQRLPAKVSLVGEGLEGVGIIGTNYSVALTLTK
ncbi:MAG: YbbR-like domain-containing protein [Evtepia sp.]